MCGIFGYSGERPEKQTIKLMADGAARRGQDGYGLGWLDRGGRLATFRSKVKLSLASDELDRLEGAPLAVGHARLATVGASDDLRNFHPFAAGDDTLLVHNGNVYNFKELIREHALATETDCDSEVLAQLVAAGQGSAGPRLASALALIETPAFAVATISGGRLAVARRRLPLFALVAHDVFYFSSFRFSADGLDAAPLAEDVAVEVTRDELNRVNLAKHVIHPVGLKTDAQTRSAWQRIRPPTGQ